MTGPPTDRSPTLEHVESFRQNAHNQQDIQDAGPGDSFLLVLQPTYFNTGFFNVPAKHARSFGSNGEEIEIYCGLSDKPITGSINRRANANGSPRIMGGAGLRDWFQQNAMQMQQLTIAVYSRNSIGIER